MGLDSWQSRETTASAGGKFEFAGIEPGRYRLTVEAQGREPSVVLTEVFPGGAPCVVSVPLGPPARAASATPARGAVSVRELQVSAKARRKLEKANVELDRKRHGAALTLARAAVAIQPDWAEAHCVTGLALMGLKRFAEAEIALSAAQSLDPRCGMARRSLGYLYLVTRREAQAVPHLAMAAALDERDGLAHACLGEALFLTGKTAEAEQPLREALALDPTFYRASYRLGYVCLRLGRTQEALEYFRAFLRTNKGLDATQVRLIVRDLEQTTTTASR